MLQGPSASCRRKPVIVFGHGFIQVGAEAEARPIRVGKRRDPHPDATRAGDGVTQAADQPAPQRALGTACDALGDLDAAESPRADRGAAIDQSRKRIERESALEQVHVDQDLGASQERLDQAGGTGVPVEEDESARRKDKGCGSLTISNGTPSCARISSNPGGVFHNSKGSNASGCE